MKQLKRCYQKILKIHEIQADLYSAKFYSNLVNLIILNYVTHWVFSCPKLFKVNFIPHEIIVKSEVPLSNKICMGEDDLDQFLIKLFNLPEFLSDGE